MKNIKSIPQSKLSRGFRFAKLTAEVGAQTLGSKFSSLLSDKAGKQIAGLQLQIKQAKKITEALSKMKGAAMKLGQILSIHGEDLFPKEVVEILSKLQQHSHTMDFPEIEKVLKAELGENWKTHFKEFSEAPIAAASIGQVHRGILASGEEVAVKVQYPGVEKTIDSDIDSLASILSVLSILPSIDGFHSIIDEVKSILKQEANYLEEAQSQKQFFDYFISQLNDESILIPRGFSSLSTRRVLTSELLKGISVQEFGSSAASPAARAFVGKKFLEIFYNEIFRLGHVQTDPNFANYKIQWNYGIQDPKVVLLDFGATKSFTPEFCENYRQMIKACIDDDYDAIRKWAIVAGFLKEEDSEELVYMHYELVKMFLEPFRAAQPYRWYENDLAQRIRAFLPKFALAFKLRPIPKDFIFLNRKIVGVYFFCSTIRAEFDPNPVLKRFL